MYCTKCGAEIDDNAIACPNCGCATINYASNTDAVETEDKNGIAIAGFVCSFFIPSLGWIFGGIGLARAKKRNGKFKGFSIASIVISCVMFVINMALL